MSWTSCLWCGGVRASGLSLTVSQIVCSFQLLYLDELLAGFKSTFSKLFKWVPHRVAALDTTLRAELEGKDFVRTKFDYDGAFDKLLAASAEKYVRRYVRRLVGADCAGDKAKDHANV